MTDNLDGARQGRDDGMDRVERGASEDFKDALSECIRAALLTRSEFITDDAWNLMREGFPDLHTRDNRVMGPLMRWAVVDGWCAPTGRYRTGRRNAGHATPQPIYQSLIYTGEVHLVI